MQYVDYYGHACTSYTYRIAGMFGRINVWQIAKSKLLNKKAQWMVKLAINTSKMQLGKSCQVY